VVSLLRARAFAKKEKNDVDVRTTKQSHMPCSVMATATSPGKRAAVDVVEIPEFLASNKRSQACRNRIRETVTELSSEACITMDLAIGDPTKHGAPFAPPAFLTDALIEAVAQGKANGYGPAFGTETARQAVATRVGRGITADDVVLGCGCSQAIELALRSIAGPGDTIVVPVPGFPLYETILRLLGVTVAYYTLDATKAWECNLASLRAALAGPRVKGVIVTNPSNPTGSVFTAAHCAELCRVVASCEGCIVLADEIYEDVVFGSTPFTSMGPLHALTRAPVITFSGLSKGFFVPGWRLGWMVTWDGHDGRLDNVRAVARKLSATLMGPCTLIQSVVPAALRDSEQSRAFRAQANAALKEGVDAFCDALEGTPGVKVAFRPQGAMYIFLLLDGALASDAFCRHMAKTQSLLCLPGECFSVPNAVRVSVGPAALMREAAARIKLGLASMPA